MRGQTAALMMSQLECRKDGPFPSFPFSTPPVPFLLPHIPPRLSPVLPLGALLFLSLSVSLPPSLTLTPSLSLPGAENE